jgi:hypothetical protein
MEARSKADSDPRVLLTIAADAIKSHEDTIRDIDYEIENTRDEGKAARMRAKRAPVLALLNEIRTRAAQLSIDAVAHANKPATHIPIQQPHIFKRKCSQGHISVIHIYNSSSGPVYWEVQC